MTSDGMQKTSSQAWYITRRWQSYAGEIRAAILRVALVATFYAVQLTHHFFFAEESAQELLFHRQATYLAAGWLLVSLAVLVALRQRFFPEHLKFVVTGVDIILLTIGAGLGAGPSSPLIGCFFLIIAMSTLRLSLNLAWFATIGSLLGYIFLVGKVDTTWFDSDHTTAPVQQLITLCSLSAAGIIAGQVIRSIHFAAHEYVKHIDRLTGLRTSEAEPTQKEPAR